MDTVIDSLEMAAEFLKRSERDPSKSKWLSFALYHALYISCVSALTRGSPNTVVEGKREWLLSFDKAITLVQDPDRMKQYTFSKPVRLTPEQEESLDELQDYRDFHWHMKPSGIIEKTLSPEIVQCIIDVIEYLVFRSGNIDLYTQDRRRRMKQALKKIRESEN